MNCEPLHVIQTHDFFFLFFPPSVFKYSSARVIVIICAFIVYLSFRLSVCWLHDTYERKKKLVFTVGKYYSFHSDIIYWNNNTVEGKGSEVRTKGQKGQV